MKGFEKWKKYLHITCLLYTSYTGDLRTLFEIRNAKEANELFLCAFRDRRALDEGFVKELQRQLTHGTYDTRRWQLGERPGEYKRHDYVTGREEVGAAPEDVADEMRELLSEIQDVPARNVLTAAAYFHAKFENIHPFADGNGRTGRLAMNYFLVLRDHPPIVIHEMCIRDRDGALLPFLHPGSAGTRALSNSPQDCWNRPGH